MLQESVRKNEKSNTGQVFRRPFGVGVLPLSLLYNSSCNAENVVESEEKEHNFRLYQCEEKDFYQLHEMLIKKTSGKYSPINGSGNNSYGIGVSVKLLHGELVNKVSILVFFLYEFDIFKLQFNIVYCDVTKEFLFFE